MWFKKKAQISGFNANKAYNGTDWRTANKTQTWIPSQILPSAADAGNYFYLPALGKYYLGLLTFVGNAGYYWLSSGYPMNASYAYYMSFSSGNISVTYTTRYDGLSVGGFE